MEVGDYYFLTNYSIRGTRGKGSEKVVSFDILGTREGFKKRLSFLKETKLSQLSLSIRTFDPGNYIARAYFL